MAFFDVQITASGGLTPLGRLLAEALANPGKAASALSRGAKELQKIRARALTRTAQDLRKILKDAVSENKLGWEPKRSYPQWFGKMGPVNIQGLFNANRSVISSYQRAAMKGKTKRQTYIRPPEKGITTKPYGKAVSLILYRVNDEAGTGVVGAIPEMRGGKKAERIFALLQGGGRNPFWDKSNPRVRGLYAALGMPLRRGGEFTIVKRPLFQPIIDKENPSALFEKNFIERLNRG